ncbi:hypothetical protein LCGC14_0764980 [marine sediment metagenome]|uniref:Uncharacterized protein n=1 Tax=marine sediment metagenome TaxID=412755 RepID=A0A0F9Q498_9ZZZZ
MATSTKAQFLFPPAYGEGAGNVLQAYGPAMAPEGMPAWLWGQGTPGAIVPFTTVNKGSLYSEVNTTDDDPALWFKVDEGGDAADWVSVGKTGVVHVRSSLFDIDAADSEQVMFHAVTASEILEVGILWEEATGTSGAVLGDITIGTATGGAEIVAATAYGLSQASGTYVTLTLKAAGASLAAGTSVFASHDDAGTSFSGTYRVLMKIRVEA